MNDSFAKKNRDFWQRINEWAFKHGAVSIIQNSDNCLHFSVPDFWTPELFEIWVARDRALPCSTSFNYPMIFQNEGNFGRYSKLHNTTSRLVLTSLFGYFTITTVYDFLPVIFQNRTFIIRENLSKENLNSRRIWKG